MKSSNIGAAHIGMMLGAEPAAGVLRAGSACSTPRRSSSSRPARTAPLLPQRWTDLSTITISYGHGMAVTPLHLAAGYAALVNGGLRVHPSIVAERRAPDRGRPGDLAAAPRASCAT